MNGLQCSLTASGRQPITTYMCRISTDNSVQRWQRVLCVGNDVSSICRAVTTLLRQRQQSHIHNDTIIGCRDRKLFALKTQS